MASWRDRGRTFERLVWEQEQNHAGLDLGQLRRNTDSRGTHGRGYRREILRRTGLVIRREGLLILDVLLGGRKLELSVFLVHTEVPRSETASR